MLSIFTIIKLQQLRTPAQPTKPQASRNTRASKHTTMSTTETLTKWDDFVPSTTSATSTAWDDDDSMTSTASVTARDDDDSVTSTAWDDDDDDATYQEVVETPTETVIDTTKTPTKTVTETAKTPTKTKFASFRAKLATLDEPVSTKTPVLTKTPVSDQEWNTLRNEESKPLTRSSDLPSSYTRDKAPSSDPARLTGTVESWNGRFGHIKPKDNYRSSSDNVFCHCSHIIGGTKLCKGLEVTYTLMYDKKHGRIAVQVTGEAVIQKDSGYTRSHTSDKAPSSDSARLTGTVESWNGRFGHIKPKDNYRSSSDNVFCHCSHIIGGTKLCKGLEVTYTLMYHKKHGRIAVQVTGEAVIQEDSGYNSRRTSGR